MTYQSDSAGHRNNKEDGDLSTTPRVVHARVPGRVRLAVPGLRNNRKLADHLGVALPRSTFIKQISANIRTGNILVHFDRRQPLTEVLVQVTRTLIDFGADKSQDAPGQKRTVPHRNIPKHIIRPTAARKDPWHSFTRQEVLTRLKTLEENGLGAAEIEKRLATYGANSVSVRHARPDVDILVDQFKSLPTALLTGSAVISLLTGGIADAIAIMCVVCLNAGIGFATERQAEKTITALDDFAQPDVKVKRDSRLMTVPAQEIVPGDILFLQPGAVVGADARLLTAHHLSVDESILTGESLPTRKNPESLLAEDIPVADRKNMIFRGTSITGGSGTAVVIATGTDTESGQVQLLVSTARPPETPTQQELTQLSRQLVFACLGALGLVFGIGLLQRRGFLEVLKTSISLAVAALPEGLPTVGTVTLALGVRSMRRERVLIRKLDALETLGAVNVMCFDKTGTLTENKIRATTIQTLHDSISVDKDGLFTVDTTGSRLSVDYNSEGLDSLLQVAALCHEVEIDGAADKPIYKGSATETSLVELAEKAGISVRDTEKHYRRKKLQHRTESQPYMVSWHENGDELDLIALKGRPEEVLDLCSQVQTGNGLRKLTARDRKKILKQDASLSENGLRVLAFAHGYSSDSYRKADLVWLGMVGMSDPTREGMAALMKRFHAAGIHTVMITGDQSGTAHAIARDLGLSRTGEIEILEGGQLDKLDPDVLASLVKNTDIFARVNPSNKLAIVEAYQKGGHVVAMTGDGINDSPALRAADIGVAMGSGSEAAHQASQIVLADNKLATLATALSMGRGIFQNIRKSLHFLLSTNMSEILISLGGMLAGRGQSLTPIQLLWINIITDVFPALALAMEPPEKDDMTRAPRKRGAPILDKKDAIEILTEGGIISLSSLASYLIALGRFGQGPRASGVVFTSLMLSQLLQAYSSRSPHHSILTGKSLPPNPYMNYALGTLFGLQLLASTTPPLRRMLGFHQTRLSDLLLAGGASASSFLAIEALKAARLEHKKADTTIGTEQTIDPTEEDKRHEQ
ncbi:cation-translocating P-type ATPase [Emcibacter nanhaiensis]|nr:HAD-IC family P-type ATPase [Emcibacter nanhaiensis]